MTLRSGVGSRRRIRTFGRGSKVLCLTTWPSGIEPPHYLAGRPRFAARRDLRRVGSVGSCDEERISGGAGFGDSRVRCLPVPRNLASGDGNRRWLGPRFSLRPGNDGWPAVCGPASGWNRDRLHKREWNRESADGLNWPFHSDACGRDMDRSPGHQDAHHQRTAACNRRLGLHCDRDLHRRLRNPNPRPGPAAVDRVQLNPTRHPTDPRDRRLARGTYRWVAGKVNPACQGIRVDRRTGLTLPTGPG